MHILDHCVGKHRRAARHFDGCPDRRFHGPFDRVVKSHVMTHQMAVIRQLTPLAHLMRNQESFRGSEGGRLHSAKSRSGRRIASKCKHFVGRDSSKGAGVQGQVVCEHMALLSMAFWGLFG